MSHISPIVKNFTGNFSHLSSFDRVVQWTHQAIKVVRIQISEHPYASLVTIIAVNTLFFLALRHRVNILDRENSNQTSPSLKSRIFKQITLSCVMGSAAICFNFLLAQLGAYRLNSAHLAALFTTFIIARFAMNEFFPHPKTNSPDQNLIEKKDDESPVTQKEKIGTKKELTPPNETDKTHTSEQTEKTPSQLLSQEPQNPDNQQKNQIISETDKTEKKQEENIIINSTTVPMTGTEELEEIVDYTAVNSHPDVKKNALDNKNIQPQSPEDLIPKNIEDELLPSQVSIKDQKSGQSICPPPCTPLVNRRYENSTVQEEGTQLLSNGPSVSTSVDNNDSSSQNNPTNTQDQTIPSNSTSIDQKGTVEEKDESNVPTNIEEQNSVDKKETTPSIEKTESKNLDSDFDYTWEWSDVGNAIKGGTKDFLGKFKFWGN